MDAESSSAASERPNISSLPPRQPLKNPLMKLRASNRASAFSSPSDKIMSPASKQLSQKRNLLAARTKGTRLASQFAAVAREQDSIKDEPVMAPVVAEDANEPIVVSTPDAMMATGEAEEANIELDEALVDEAEEVESEPEEAEQVPVTALPRKPIARPLMRLRAGPRAAAFSSPSDKIMSPTSQQLHQNRHRMIARQEQGN
ncbi:hypothetical protein THASP1DRAFT_31492 [Thamnocephalis sphaerospora]|uniref:Uncharacterized protein n=1 Tax=Thamnocephalis sphaerospora TaxID=78915 RepID=A0A4P9XLF7_9FUNG|nr:hypothetical protein THASP1DRAFT_31492 [Thamnocephalis sphaerospora]|eukprot:RKP06693.1 hypothetical protein THASP1DRAFT_31492 [Thamnocephalis sphaerospora]